MWFLCCMIWTGWFIRNLWMVDSNRRFGCRVVCHVGYCGGIMSRRVGWWGVLSWVGHWRRGGGHIIVHWVGLVVRLMVCLVLGWMVGLVVRLVLVMVVRVSMVAEVVAGGRGPDEPGWLAVVGAGVRLGLLHVRGQRRAVADAVAVSEVSVVPLLLQQMRSAHCSTAALHHPHPGPAVAELGAAGRVRRAALGPVDRGGAEGVCRAAAHPLARPQVAAPQGGGQHQQVDTQVNGIAHLEISVLQFYISITFYGNITHTI